MLHNEHCRVFRTLHRLVQGVADGDRGGAAEVARRLAAAVAALRRHTTSQDEIVWPAVLDRAPADSVLVLCAEEQHERIDRLLTRAQARTAAFVGAAAAIERARLTAALDALSEVLEEHAAQEESQLLPVAERALTAAEWSTLSVRSQAG